MSRRGAIPIRRVAGTSVTRLLVVLAALAGLFAMHGMSEHGVAHHDSSVMSTSTTSADVMVMTLGISETAADAAAHTQTGVRDAVAVAVDMVGDGADMAMMLCLAVLAGLVLLLARGRGLRVGLVLRPVVAGAGVRLALTARDPVPPDLHVLSVQRC